MDFQACLRILQRGRKKLLLVARMFEIVLEMSRITQSLHRVWACSVLGSEALDVRLTSHVCSKLSGVEDALHS